MQRRLNSRFSVRAMATLVAAVLLTLGTASIAAELPDGTVISKDNLDRIKDDTFMGHTVASLLTEKVEWQIRNTGRKLRLGESKEPPADPKWVEATAKYAGQPKYDPKTREVTGYMAGLPFPDVSATDPDAGEKIMWNYYYGAPYPHDFLNDVYFVTINNQGYEASQRWIFSRILNKGRLGEDKTVLADPEVLTKSIFVARDPQDIKGTGTFTVRYDVPGKLEDQWAYIKSARRIRRLSGNSWMDPIGGFDVLNDDIYVVNSRPSQYVKNKLIGKRWILAVTDYKVDRNAGKAGTVDEFPGIDPKQAAPYWYQTATWTPREVWVVEATPPEEHPYSKKVVYVDVKVPAIYLGEVYDKKGEFWRDIDFFYGVRVGQATGITYYTPLSGQYIDFKAKHATQFIAPGVYDRKGASWDKFTPEALESMQ
jgi:hypothetical protein